MNNWRNVAPARETFCSNTRGVRYLRVGTSSSMVRQAERGSSTISFNNWGDLRRRVIKEIPILSSRAKLAQVGVGVTEGAASGVLSQKGEDAGLTAAARRHVMAFDDGIFAVVGDGVEVEVEGCAVKQTLGIHAVMPGAQQLTGLGVGNAGGILRQVTLLGKRIESGK